MNLLYIRAAIEQATGVTLDQEDILSLLVEEGLLTRTQASNPDLIFRGYAEFFETDEATVRVEPVRHLLTDISDEELDQAGGG